MMTTTWTRALVGAVALATLGACTTYGPPPPGWVGERWHRHVVRCERAYPRYDPRTDMIYRPSGNIRCPL